MTSTQFVLSRIPSSVSPFSAAAARHDAVQLRQYDRLATLYERGLRAIGAPITCFDAPSIYQTTEALGTIRVSASSAHLAVRPIADIRPFHGLPDYIVFDGPLNDLDCDVPGSLRSADHILKAATRVFCTTALLTEALTARGIVTATTLPPPATSDEAEGNRSVPLQQINAIKLDDFKQVAITSLCSATRATGGQVLYWDAHGAVDVGLALKMVLGAVERSGMRAANCCLIVAGFNASLIARRARKSRQSFDGVYGIEETLDHDQKRALARDCDIFIRVSISSGLDLEVLAAVENGALTIVPQGHSAIELIGSQCLTSYDPALAMPSWGNWSRQRCPDLIRSLKEAIEVPLPERAARRRHAAHWFRSTYGLETFADRLRSQVGAL